MEKLWGEGIVAPIPDHDRIFLNWSSSFVFVIEGK